MADNTFDILIRFGLSKEKAEQARAELGKLKEQTTATGQEGVKQEAAVEEATKKTFTSKSQLKAMVKGLTYEFPLLGRAAHLALNPLAFTTAAIAGAFVIWNRRVNELTKSLGGIAMPDVSTTATERINIHAAAWGLLAQKMADAANASIGIKTGLDQALATIKANEDLFKAMGIDTATKGDEARAAAIQQAADDLRASGRARIARAGTPGSTVAEGITGGKFSQAVTAAMSDKSAAQARLNQLLEMGEKSIFNPMRHVENFRFLDRYGGMSVDQAMGEERANIRSQDNIIKAGDRFALSSESRAVRRGERAGGEADIAAADKMAGVEVVQLLRQIANGVAGRAPLPTNAPGNLEEAASFAAAMARFANNLPELMAAIERANAQIKNMSQRP